MGKLKNRLKTSKDVSFVSVWGGGESIECDKSNLSASLSFSVNLHEEMLMKK